MDDVEHILTELHDGLEGNHSSRETTAHKVKDQVPIGLLYSKIHMHMHVDSKYVK